MSHQNQPISALITAIIQHLKGFPKIKTGGLTDDLSIRNRPSLQRPEILLNLWLLEVIVEKIGKLDGTLTDDGGLFIL